jgi:hypothetical protein
MPEDGPALFVGLDGGGDQAGRVDILLAATLRFGHFPEGRYSPEDLSGTLRETQPCTISLRPAAGEDRRLALHIKSIGERRFVLSINGKRSIDLVIGKGAVFTNGKAIMKRGDFTALEAAVFTYSDGR